MSKMIGTLTCDEAKELLLELNESRTRLKGSGMTGMALRHEREAEILNTLANESGSILIYGMAIRADQQAKNSRSRVREYQSEEKKQQDMLKYLNM